MARPATGMPRAIWALGFVSLLMDISSEMIHSLLPVYLVSVLGASGLTVGIIEGVAEATASITKVFSGAISDWVGKRKLLAVIGYGLAAFTKPILLMWLTLDNYRIVFWVAVIPAFLSVAMLVFGVREPERPAGLRKVRAPLSLGELRRMGPAYWTITGVATVFTLARFSEAFLILRAQGAGVPIVVIPLVLVVMNVTYALAAYPAGVLSDRVSKVTVLMAGVAVLIAADLVLALGGSIPVVAFGVVLWGLHMGLTQGLLASLVAETAPLELRGTGFGVFNLAGGAALLTASVVAGQLWDAAGPVATFAAGAAVAALSLAGLAVVRLRMPRLGAVPESPA